MNTFKSCFPCGCLSTLVRCWYRNGRRAGLECGSDKGQGVMRAGDVSREVTGHPPLGCGARHCLVSPRLRPARDRHTKSSSSSSSNFNATRDVRADAHRFPVSNHPHPRVLACFYRGAAGHRSGVFVCAPRLRIPKAKRSERRPDHNWNPNWTFHSNI